ncbi:dCTP deaminase, partial [candidate division WWE3 bacterium CG_4_10_14_0_2_um_filter_42_8]
MILADSDIKKALKTGKIKIDPPPDLEEQLGSCSLDFKLGNVFKVFNHSSFPYIDPRQPQDENLMKEIVVEKDKPFIMQPHDFVLAVTQEYIDLPDDLLGRL